MNKKKQEKILQLMHKFGKLTSCNVSSPARNDLMFLRELDDLYVNKTNLLGEKLE